MAGACRRSCSPMRVVARRGWLWGVVAALAAMVIAWSPPCLAAPQIGYVYPAGGRRGSTFVVEVGGQSLRGSDAVRISGEGGYASVVEYVRPLNNEELRKTEQFVRDLVRRRWSARAMEAARAKADEPALPDHPWLRDIEAKSPGELARLQATFFDPRRQPNAQIAEQVLLEVTVDAGAAPGDRELRVASPDGMSNPLCFQVGVLPEVCEKDFTGGKAAPVVDTPVLLNGQIGPGERDRVRLRLRQGQRLVIQAQARHLVPYLADAVPGWFQAVLALYSPDGRELAWNDDYRFEPDPVLLVEVPANGVYDLEIRDAIYRGRDDFVYRIAVGVLPFVTQAFPLGGREGTPVTAALGGWNLPAETLRLDTGPGGGTVRTALVGAPQGLGNEVRYAVDALPDVAEVEPNDDPGCAQAVAFPQAVNGRIGRPGDVDTFSFSGRAGQVVVADVMARRLSSPLDAALRLVDADGTVVAFNDDSKDPEMGLLTHHADPALQAELPRDGLYRVCLWDAQRQGGEPYAYRLRLRTPQPDFALRQAPSCVTVRPGQAATLTVHAVRRDGFAGDIDLRLLDAPAGFVLNGTRIPAGKDSLEVRLGAPRGVPRQVFPVRLEGRAEVGGETVSRPAVAAEDMMQAFLWRFLVPRQELLVAVAGIRPVPTVWQPLLPGARLTSATPVRVPLGGAARVEIAAPQTLADPARTALASVRFRLANQPRGVTLRQADAGPAGIAVELTADANCALPGDAANVIVEAFADATPAGGPPTAPARSRVSLGVLPAIPYEVVRP